MQLAKVPLTVSSHESAEPHLEDPRQLRRSVDIFRKEVEAEINRMAHQHAEQLRRLYSKIQEQQRLIDAYERRYGRIDADSPARKQNHESQEFSKHASMNMSAALTKLSRTANLQNSHVLNRPSDSPIKLMNKHSQQEEGFLLGQNESFQLSPPDQLYKSRYEQRSRSRRISEREVYNTLKQNKESVQSRTRRLLEMVGEAKPQEQEAMVLDAIQKTKEPVRRVRDRDEELNSSLSFICDSLERSKHKLKKKQSLKPVRPQPNPEEEKRKEGKQRLQYILREMREKITVSPNQPKKKEEIKTSKLLTTGHPGTSKVLINPVPMDLTRKESARANSPGQSAKNTSSILKNSSEGRYTKTIEGLSEISRVTRQSSPSKLFL